MKVTCEYCGCYVEADENMKCPNCIAGLGSAVQAERERIAKEEEAERQREAEEKAQEAEQRAQEAKEEHVSEIIKGVAGVATTLVAGITASKTAKQENDVEGRRPIPPEGHEHHARMDFPDDRSKHARIAGSEPTVKHARVHEGEDRVRMPHPDGRSERDGAGNHARTARHDGPDGMHPGGMPGGGPGSRRA